MTLKEKKQVIKHLEAIRLIALNTTDATGLNGRVTEMVKEYSKPSRYPICEACKHELVSWYSHAENCPNQ